MQMTRVSGNLTQTIKEEAKTANGIQVRSAVISRKKECDNYGGRRSRYLEKSDGHRAVEFQMCPRSGKIPLCARVCCSGSVEGGREGPSASAAWMGPQGPFQKSGPLVSPPATVLLFLCFVLFLSSTLVSFRTTQRVAFLPVTDEHIS